MPLGRLPWFTEGSSGGTVGWEKGSWGGRAGAVLRVFRCQACLLGALDLGDPAVVHDKLHDAEAEPPDLVPHKGEPFGLARRA
jgi:hypothetical protein